MALLEVKTRYATYTDCTLRVPTLSEEIALELGETRETVTATLSILENCHLIERQGTESIFFKQCQTEQEKVIESE